MRSAHSRHAFAALDNLIDRHYIIDMREQMEKVYILLEKDLATEYVRVAGVFASRELAESELNYLMDFNEEELSYKIDEKVIRDAV